VQSITRNDRQAVLGCNSRVILANYLDEAILDH
jgi:hypothetical protein